MKQLNFILTLIVAIVSGAIENDRLSAAKWGRVRGGAWGLQ